MEQNVGMADRYIRIALGSFLLSAGCARMVRNTDLTAIGLGLVGGIMLSEGVLGTCPLYKAMGINTNQSESTQPDEHDPEMAEALMEATDMT